MTTCTVEERPAEVRGVMPDIDGRRALSDQPTGEHGQPLPGAVELIETGRVLSGKGGS